MPRRPRKSEPTPLPALPDDEFTVHCLASGSSANSLLVIGGGSALLVDAGLGLRTLKRELEARGVSPGSLSGILLTHEHTDHARGASAMARKYHVPVVATPGTLLALSAKDRRDPPVRPLKPGEEAGLGPFGVVAVPVSHDAAEPAGFRVAFRDQTLVYATDTGTVTPELREASADATLLVIESNHDIHKLRFGPYPEVVKARILGRFGHLSNNAACDLILGAVEARGPVSAWLAHLSQTNNTPAMALNYWKHRSREAGHKSSPALVEVALRDVPSLVHRARSRAVQLALF